MGYTHYWKRPRNNFGSPEMFGRLALDAKKIIAQGERDGIRIRNAYGEGEPEFNEARFGINGDALGTRTEVSGALAPNDLAHESFIWEGIPSISEWRKDEPETFDFCKTAYKPYDVVVGAILIRAKHIYGYCVSISSDGDWESIHWTFCSDLYQRVFGEVAECPFDKVEV